MLDENKVSNWGGLVHEIIRTCDDTNVELLFRGRKVDYDDLEQAIGHYIYKHENKINVLLNFDEIQNDDIIMDGFDTIFEKIKNKPLSQFKFTNRKGMTIFDTYEEAKNGIFEVSVIAPMSSGKSTLINSLLHTELLPCANEACTATSIRILNNNSMRYYEATCYAEDEGTVIHKRKKVSSELLKEYNADENIFYIDMEGNVPDIPNNQLRLCIRDTPGPNNPEDEKHRELVHSIIRRKNSVILYVLNATQFMVDSDLVLLNMIATEMKREGKQSRDKFIFLINKCDELEIDKEETSDRLVEKAKIHLENLGISNPILIPISAKMALAIRKKRNNEQLYRSDHNALNDVEDFVKMEKLHYDEYAIISTSVREYLQKEVNQYHQNTETWDLEALIHAGVRVVEETICEYINKYAYPIKIKNLVEDLEGILTELNMQGEFQRIIEQNTIEKEKIKKQIRIAKNKYEKTTDIYRLFEAEIKSIGIKDLDKRIRNWKSNAKIELEQITSKYKEKTEVDRNEAKQLIDELKQTLANTQNEYENKLRIEIENELFYKCEKMLKSYRKVMENVLVNIQIDGYDFKKNNSFAAYQINSVDEVVQDNLSERYVEQLRSYDNPARKGILGCYKFWLPKKIFEVVYIRVKEKFNVKK